MSLKISATEVRYPGFTLSIPEIDLKPGIYHVRGGNGSGKTTLFQFLLGMLDSPNEMSDVNLVGIEKGYVPQAFREALLPWLNVEQNLRLFRSSRSDPKLILEQLRFAESDLHKRIFSLSGGQAQRVVLARELSAQPQMLILDEPFSALDRPTVGVLSEMLLEQRPSDQIMLVASHVDIVPRSAAGTPYVIEISRETDSQATVCVH